MKSAYLLDTDWAIDFLNGQQETVEKIRELREYGLALSLISLAELYEGVITPEIRQKANSSSQTFSLEWR